MFSIVYKENTVKDIQWRTEAVAMVTAVFPCRVLVGLSVHMSAVRPRGSKRVHRRRVAPCLKRLYKQTEMLKHVASCVEALNTGRKHRERDSTDTVDAPFLDRL